jgi:hypothetical protein
MYIIIHYVALITVLIYTTYIYIHIANPGHIVYDCNTLYTLKRDMHEMLPLYAYQYV